jgi:hypothetical protein
LQNAFEKRRKIAANNCFKYQFTMDKADPLKDNVVKSLHKQVHLKQLFAAFDFIYSLPTCLAGRQVYRPINGQATLFGLEDRAAS